MNKIKSIYTIVFILSVCFNSFSQSNCNQLPKRFVSYSEAISKIKSANFKIDQSVNTSKSSWIRGAIFYSCDGNYGFLIIKTSSKEFIHKDVPISVWEGFKNASSFGSYYDYNIKNRYLLNLK